MKTYQIILEPPASDKVISMPAFDCLYDGALKLDEVTSPLLTSKTRTDVMDPITDNDARRISINSSSSSTNDLFPEESGSTQLPFRSHTKSRTGCATCKTRRIKCDEAKPACERCQKGGFTCDGYALPDLRKSKVVSQRPHKKSKAGCGHCKARRVKCDEGKPKCSWCSKTSRDCIYERPDISSKVATEDRLPSSRPLQPKKPTIARLNLNLVIGGKREKEAFYHYVTQLGPMLSGSCDREFWTRILTQTSCVDPAIWHSVMSISMLQQHSLSRSPEADGKVLKYHSLQHYNKAVELLTKPALDVQVRSETLIIACAVFACIEVMLGDIESSKKHILSGVRIVSDWKQQSFRAPGYQRTLMEKHMEPIFDNLVGQSSFYVSRNVFEQLKQDTLQLAKECRILPPALNSRAYAKASARKQDLLIQSHAWLRVFENILGRPALVDLKIDEIDAIPFMRYQHMILHISIETLLCTDELEYDRHYGHFKTAMDLADEALLGVMIRGPKLSTSLLPSLNSENTPLFTIATKCRNPRIRHRALEFMRKTKEELIFRDDDLSVKVAERAVQIEEEGLENLTDETGDIVPSDWARVYEIVVEPRSGDQIPGDHRAAVSFKRRERSGGVGWVWVRGFVDYKVTKCASS